MTFVEGLGLAFLEGLIACLLIWLGVRFYRWLSRLCTCCESLDYCDCVGRCAKHGKRRAKLPKARTR